MHFNKTFMKTSHGELFHQIAGAMLLQKLQFAYKHLPAECSSHGPV